MNSSISAAPWRRMIFLACCRNPAGDTTRERRERPTLE
jgi:hypothetical protein